MPPVIPRHAPTFPAVPPRTRATLLAASSLTIMAGAIVAPALPQIGAAFAGQVPNPEFVAKMVLALPALAIALFAPVSGWIVDRFGCKRLLLAGLALYAAAGTSGLYFSEPYPILAGRLLLGVAVAMVMTATSTLISFYFHGAERGRFLGFQATATVLGGVVFLPLGGLLADFGDWQWPFVIYVASLPILLAATRFVTEPDRGPAKTSTGATVVTGEYPLAVPWATLGLIYAVAFVGMAAFGIGPFQLPFHVTERFGVRAFVASLAVATMTAHAALTSIFYGRLAGRFGRDRLLAAFFVLLGSGFTVVGLARHPAGTYLGLAVAGLGGGLFTPTLMNWLMRTAPTHLRGRLTGGLISAMFAGQFLSPILAQPVVDAGGPAAAFEACGVGMVALGAAYAARTAWLHRRHRPARVAVAAESLVTS